MRDELEPAALGVAAPLGGWCQDLVGDAAIAARMADRLERSIHGAELVHLLLAQPAAGEVQIVGVFFEQCGRFTIATGELFSLQRFDARAESVAVRFQRGDRTVIGTVAHYLRHVRTL